MLRWILFTSASGCFALGLLTLVRAPDWAEWRLAVLAGEYGYAVAGLPLLIAFLAASTRGTHSGVALATLLVSALAIGLLVRPVIEAARVAQVLPERLSTAFGAMNLTRETFAVSALVGRSAEPVAIETREFAPGLLLDYYRPAKAAGPVPCVMVVHGGGWDSGDRTQLASFNHWIASLGYAVAATSYRLAPQHTWPSPREDTLAAIAYLKANAVSLGLDPARLVLLGRSAGGQIAEVVAYTVRDPAVRGLVALYSPSDLNFGYANAWEDDALKSPTLMRQYLGGPPETAKAAYDSASALNHVTADSPPTLQLHGRLDGLVWHRHSERLEARLNELKVPNVFVSLPWATHAFEVNQRGPGGQLTTYAVEWFLAAVTKPAPKV
jgi:acetyl esterase/lipase